MQKSKMLLLIGFLGFLTFFVFQGINKKIEAGSEHNVSGYAWSENIGWISFNNTSGGGAVNYGVNINSPTGILSGYAWSENIGWISFNEAELSGCPVSPCRAQADLSCPSNQCPVSGWARALSYGAGWDGWIKLRKGPADGGANYGVYIDKNTGQFYNFAWGSDIVGWISFNCNNPELPAPRCSGSNYKVVTSFAFNTPPEARNLNYSLEDCCFLNNPAIFLSWEFYDADGDSQTAYQVQVDNNSNFSSPEIDSGKVISSSTTYPPPNLLFGTTYYWRVMVWDSKDRASSLWATGPSFATPSHKYPWPDFSWSPAEPKIGEVVEFNPDSSTVYGGATISSYLWTITQGTGTFVDGTNANSRYPHIVFSTQQNKVKLKITDSDGFGCEVEKNITGSLPLPEWIEIRPF